MQRGKLIIKTSFAYRHLFSTVLHGIQVEKSMAHLKQKIALMSDSVWGLEFPIESLYWKHQTWTQSVFLLQMVSIRRLSGPKNPAEMTYYIQVDGSPMTGTAAAKTLNTVDSQTMALTLGYFVQVQAERMYINHSSTPVYFRTII